MENKEIDKLFRDAFADAEETPRSDVWHRIEAALDKETPEHKIAPVRKKAYHWTYYAAAASVLLALGIVISVMQRTEQRELVDSNIAVHQPTEKADGQPSESITTPPADVENAAVAATPATEPQRKPVVVAVAKKPAEKHAGIPELEQATPLLQSIEEEAAPPKLDALASVDNVTPTYRVTDVEPIQPLIVPDEELESMYAAAEPETTPHGTVVTALLNKISENIESNNARQVRFRADEEGSIRIDIVNALVKNRSKKRR